MPNIGQFKIFGYPKHETVSTDTTALYKCKQVQSTLEPMGRRYRRTLQWICLNDRTTAAAYGKPYIVKGPENDYSWIAKWAFPGKHTVYCSIQDSDEKNPVVLEYPQWVDTTEAILGKILKEQKSRKQAVPEAEESAARRYADVLRKGEKMSPIYDPKEKKKHDELVASMEAYAEKLHERLESTKKCHRYPVAAAHIEKESQNRSELRVFVAAIRSDEGDHHWELVDWTNAAHRHLTGVYEGYGATAEEAIKEAIDDWDSGNRYPNGTILLEVPPDAAEGVAIKVQLDTNGASFWDSIASFFEYIAFGAMVVAGVVTLLVPEPGSKVVSAAIWTSIFSSSTAAIINIGQRYDEGFSNWKDEAFDGLTLIGNAFGGAWIRCAKVTAQTSKGAKTFVLLGQVGTDGVQGALIAVESYGEYESIMNDKSLSPRERTRKLLEFFRKIGIQGAMLYVSMKGTKTDIDNLGAGHIEKEKLAKMRDPNHVEDLTIPPKVQGEVEEGKLVTKKQDEQARDDHTSPFPKPGGAKVPGKKTVFPPALPAAQRGMRPRDHRAFSNAAKKAPGKIILVRNSNKAAADYVGKPGYKPKPMEIKEKTRKTPPNEGLVAIDPADPSFGGDMAKWQKAVDDYKTRGWSVGDASEGYVLRDKKGNAYYSDYDLHGVYDGKTGANAYSEQFRGEMNARLGDDIVQHGPHDNWPDRLNAQKAGVNYGPQPPCTAYLPDGTSVHLNSVDDMMVFYQEHKISWEGAYGGVDWKKYNEMQAMKKGGG